ncbi:MAG: TrkA C-terminal domain-containing protein [Pseudomonadales bacterium]
MSSVYFLAPTLITVLVSMLIVRGAAIALVMTGMSYEKAKFQALSAFSGTGFTTREAERVVGDARRRRIVSWLMILGNAGIVTVIVTTTSSFANAEGMGIGLNALVLVGGLAIILTLARHAPWVRRWEAFVQARLERLKTFENDLPIDELLHISTGFGVSRIQLPAESPFVGSNLAEINAALADSMVLGIERGYQWIPIPGAETTVAAGDYLTIYGRLDQIVERFAHHA